MKRIALAVIAMLCLAACTPNHGNPAGTGQGYPDDPKAGDSAQ